MDVLIGAVVAAALAFLAGEAGRRIERRHKRAEEASADLVVVHEILRDVKTHVLPHYIPRPGREAQTLPARGAELEATAHDSMAQARINNEEIQGVRRDLRDHMAEELTERRLEIKERKMRQAETDRKFADFGNRLEDALKQLTAGNPEIRRP